MKALKDQTRVSEFKPTLETIGHWQGLGHFQYVLAIFMFFSFSTFSGFSHTLFSFVSLHFDRKISALLLRELLMRCGGCSHQPTRGCIISAVEERLSLSALFHLSNYQQEPKQPKSISAVLTFIILEGTR